MKIKKIILYLLLSIVVLPVFSQEENQDIREGNKLYHSEKYTEAEIAYRKGLLKNPHSMEAAYNLGNALFRQEKYAEALEQYQRVIPTKDIPKDKLAAALHNTGNALLMEQKVAESIEAYKSSLMKNPLDDETRYNLALAQHLLKQQENNQDQNKEQDQKQDEQEDKKQKQQQQQEEQQQEEQQPSNLSKERAEQVLEALMQDEEDTMEKAKKQPATSRKSSDKDW